jgi:hypothetical protein
MKKVCLLAVTALLFGLSGKSLASDKIIPLKDNKSRETEYSSVLCFRFSVTDKGRLKTKTKLKDQPDKKLGYTISYFDGSKLATINFYVNGYIKDNIIYSSDIVYLAAIPGKYELVGIDYTITNEYNYMSTYVFPINATLDLNAGKAYYAGEVIINEDENHKLTGTLFNNIIINQTVISDFENRYPNTFNMFKNNFLPGTFLPPSPMLSTNVRYSSRFTKDEGKWRETNDSLHTASFENGQYCIESKSAFNMGSEVIELPEKLGNSFDIELHCTWKRGGNATFGLIMPGKGAPLAPKPDLEPAGYIFGITANGYACLWFEQVPSMLGKTKKTVALTDWKKIPNFKINDSGQNTIRLQVIDRVISFYVDDILVVRSPYNSESPANKTEFLYSNSNLLGIFSFNKQKIEFNEIKFSKFQ